MGLRVFDFQVHNGVVYLVSADVNRVVLDVLTMDGALLLTRVTSQSIPVVISGDVGQGITGVNSVETALRQDGTYLELVIGAVVNTDTAGVFVMGTGLRACTEL
jgi:hypothetical protein